MKGRSRGSCAATSPLTSRRAACSVCSTSWPSCGSPAARTSSTFARSPTGSAPWYSKGSRRRGPRLPSGRTEAADETMEASVKILVTLKRVPDPEMRPKFKGNALDLSGVTWAVNTFDEYAVETALRLTEKGDSGERIGEVVVLSIGPKESAQQVRQALAM